MKRWAWLIVLTATAAPGCLLLGPGVKEDLPRPVEVNDARPPAPVTADQVTEENCREILQRLQDEVHREQEGLYSARP